MILVTGGTGLVGAHLLLHLIESRSIGRKERAYRNLESIEKQSRYLVFTKKKPFDTIEWIEADIVNIPSLELAFQGIEYAIIVPL
jgi:uncharacterized protein YbjT (DUF2867 family)